MSEYPLLSQGKVLKGPFEVFVDITNKCNYRCLHCYNASGENTILDDEMTDDEYLAFVQDIVSLEPYNVCFCGGEPLLKLDLVLKSLKILKNGGIKNASLVSNGYFANYDTLKKLHENGLKRIQFSLDGATKESCSILRQVDCAYDRVIDALKATKEVGFESTTIAFCPTKFNINEFSSVVKICMDFGVSMVRVQPLMAIGRAMQNIEKIMPTKEQYVELICKINELNLKCMNLGMTIEWGDPLDHIFRYKDHMRHLNIFAGIKANGSICPSPYLPVSVGNVKRHKFSEYWNHGLCRAWSLPQIKNLADNVLCISDMGSKKVETPNVWYEKDIELDIIDDGLFEEQA